MKRLLVYIVSAILGLWLAVMFIPGVHISLYSDSSFFGFQLTAIWQIYLLLGVLLGLLNFFIKPLLDLITLPLRIITLGLFGFLVDVVLVVALDIMFRELSVPWLFPLLWTTLVIWILTFLFSRFVNNNEA
jgi:putative membrane protein